MRFAAAFVPLALAACEPSPDPDYRGQNTVPVEAMQVDSAAVDSGALDSAFLAIERDSGGELGVSAVVVENGRTVGHRDGEAFPMASTYKLPIALAVLAQVDSGRVSLDDTVRLTPADYRLGPGPVSERLPAGGGTVTVRRMIESMMMFSDNTATDALMRLTGGPRAVMAHLRARGVEGMRVDRYEGEVYLDYNGVTGAPPPVEWTPQRVRGWIDSVPPAQKQAARERFFADVRDTSTPDAMAALLVQVQRGEWSSPTSRGFLLDAMRRSPTGARRIRAGVPRDTEVADKTGTIGRVTNDAGLVTLPDGTHVALAVFVRNSTKTNEQVEPVIAAAARAVYAHFAGTGGASAVTGQPRDTTVARDSAAGRDTMLQQ
ncbi:class A beta-lactamase [Longimicrobium sp.]|uniref:class A beta-lactamase n=1 Tax=Longimicrobium sp. TaxID=2029185 RepID=UPI003B3A0F2D